MDIYIVILHQPKEDAALANLNVKSIHQISYFAPCSKLEYYLLLNKGYESTASTFAMLRSTLLLRWKERVKGK